MLQADDEARLDPLRLAGQLEGLDATRQLREESALRSPGEVRAEAEMFPVAEAEVMVRLPVDAEAVGLLEHLLVPVGRGVGEHEVIARADRPAAQLEVAGRGASHVI